MSHLDHRGPISIEHPPNFRKCGAGIRRREMLKDRIGEHTCDDIVSERQETPITANKHYIKLVIESSPGCHDSAQRRVNADDKPAVAGG
jgi:hypothetical protein